MQSNQPIESKRMRDARILLEILTQREVDIKSAKPLKQAFAEHRKRMKILHADLFNNNHARSRERH